ncbi:MAG: hypothetical protein KDB14_11545 [Planctomycetales bacterium]|nr:hypothetical protein [Planctomycetales bacterium]
MARDRLAVLLPGDLARRIGFAAPRTSGRNIHRQVAESLNTTGMYSVVRHPLYLGNFLIALGIVAQPGDLITTGLFIAIFTLYYERIMITEEAFLATEHGEVFQSWSKQTPAFVPRWSQYRQPGRPLNWARIVRHEGAAVAVICFSFGLLELGEHAENVATLEPWWPPLVITGIGLFALGRVTRRWIKEPIYVVEPDSTSDSPPPSKSTD